jgi:hypothetical protein
VTELDGEPRMEAQEANERLMERAVRQRSE